MWRARMRSSLPQLLSRSIIPPSSASSSSSSFSTAMFRFHSSLVATRMNANALQNSLSRNISKRALNPMQLYAERKAAMFAKKNNNNNNPSSASSSGSDGSSSSNPSTNYNNNNNNSFTSSPSSDSHYYSTPPSSTTSSSAPCFTHDTTRSQQPAYDNSSSYPQSTISSTPSYSYPYTYPYTYPYNYNQSHSYASQPHTNTNTAGSKDNPIQVVVLPDKRINWLRVSYWVLLLGLGVVFYDTIQGQFEKISTVFKRKYTAAPIPKVKFEDVKGCDEAKEELKEIAEFLKNPAKYNRLGGNLPKGVILTGQPGTGKTLLAKAVAGEAGVPFFNCSGSEFEEMFVGLGSSRIRDLFASARAAAPAIIFIDEIDAVGSKRRQSDVSHARQSLNQLLTELDGFQVHQGIIVMAATNFPEVLDPALTRPGRFDRSIDIPSPDVRGRKQILDLYGGKVKLDPSVDMSIIAKNTPGCTGAHLAEIVNYAAITAASKHEKFVTMKHLELAKDKVLMGTERLAKNTEETRRLQAYHESGHALVAKFTVGTSSIHKATITPRGNYRSRTHLVPEDQLGQNREQLMALVDVKMGGRAAEELVFGGQDVTKECSDDLQAATSIATQMIRNYAMGKELTVVDPKEDRVSMSALKRTDAEIQQLLKESYHRASDIIRGHTQELHELAQALLKYETLDAEEINKIINGQQLTRDI